jgi:uncharacterized membrane protein YhhN
MKVKLNYTFFMVLLLHILARETGVVWLGNLSKPLLMPLLMILVFFENKYRLKGIVLLIAALVFSFLGDVFLMYSGESFFVAGLSSFLLAHLFYTLIFLRYKIVNSLLVLPFIAYAALMVFGVLSGKIPESLQIPVWIYIAVIMFMGVTAAMAAKLLSRSYQNVLVGAILFILSDSFIAVNKFVAAVPQVSFLVMSTYGIAQFLIVKGVMEQECSGR